MEAYIVVKGSGLTTKVARHRSFLLILALNHIPFKYNLKHCINSSNCPNPILNHLLTKL